MMTDSHDEHGKLALLFVAIIGVIYGVFGFLQVVHDAKVQKQIETLRTDLWNLENITIPHLKK